MRVGNILVQPVAGTGGQMFVMMDESTGTEITFTADQMPKIHTAMGYLIISDEIMSTVRQSPALWQLIKWDGGEIIETITAHKP